MNKIVGYKRPAPGTQPNYLPPPYQSSIRRAPGKPLILLPHTLSEVTGPLFGHELVGPTDHDLTKQHAGEPIGERMILSGRVLDENGRPVQRTLIELWQANSTGRYRPPTAPTNAPPEPKFTGT